MDVGEAEVSALEAVGEAFVIQAQQVQDGGVQVVDMDFAGVDTEAEVIGGAVNVVGLPSTVIRTWKTRQVPLLNNELTELGRSLR